MAVDSFCMPRPLVEVPPEEELGAATADSGVGLDNVDEVGLETGPARESDVVVVVVEVGAGATVLVVAGAMDVESLLAVVVPSEVVVGALTEVEPVAEVLLVSICTVASGADFLMSLCGFLAGARSFVVERDLTVVRSDS